MVLSKDDLAHYEALLRAARDELRRAGTMKIEPKHSGDTPREADEDGEPLVEMHQVIASNRNRARTGSLRQIDAALARLGEDFGLCVECDEPIAARRLELMPHAERCLPCQSEHEEAQRGPGGRRKLTDFV